MNLDFNEEQTLLRDTIRSLCKKEASFDAIRALENDERGYSLDFWNNLSEIGVCGLLVEEEYGGVGMGLLECAAVYEEMGRSLVPSPHFSSNVLYSQACFDE